MSVPRSPAAGLTLTMIPNAVAVPKSSAPRKAPMGVHRPKITAASAMKPASAGHAVLERAGRLEREVRAREARDRAADDHVHVALAEDVDADRVGRFRMLADRAGP